MKYLICLGFILINTSCGMSLTDVKCSQGLRWSGLPIYIKPLLKDNKPVLDAINVWNDSIGREMFVVNFDSGVEVIDSNSYDVNNTTQAKTFLYFDNFGIIRNADIKIYRSDMDLESTMIHELGHLLGVLHSDLGTENTMSAYLPINKKRIFVDKWTRSQVICKYKKNG